MDKKNKSPESMKDWQVSFEQVGDEQLRDMLKATPAQRLAMAEELLQFTKAIHRVGPR